MEFTSADAERRYAAFVRVAERAVVGLDFDGTLAPIVDDPTKAHIHPDAPDVLVRVARQVRAVAVVTGRPARQALDLGGLEEVGDAVEAAGKELFVVGQYGNERWSSSRRRIRGPVPPAGLAGFGRDLPRALRQADAAQAWIEDKGLAVAVHTRRLADADAAFDRVLPVLTDLARRHDLCVEPGKQVVEVRSGGMHKGVAVHRLAEELDAAGFLFAGDDLGDVEAFEALGELDRDGLAVLRVCSASEESSELARRADVLVPGPEGVLALLDRIAAEAREARA